MASAGACTAAAVVSLPDACSWEHVLAFWFPPGLDADQDRHAEQFRWWFAGGADAAICSRYPSLLHAASHGELDRWAEAPRSRLALIIVLDQFSRSIHRGTPAAYAQDGTACRLAIEGIGCGHYGALQTVWERTFFSLPFGHAEQLPLNDYSVRLAEALVPQAPRHLRALYTFSASQAQGHRDVVARFGRQPHRNSVLGRASTAAETAYLAAGDFVHRRSFAA